MNLKIRGFEDSKIRVMTMNVMVFDPDDECPDDEYTDDKCTDVAGLPVFSISILDLDLRDLKIQAALKSVKFVKFIKFIKFVKFKWHCLEEGNSFTLVMFLAFQIIVGLDRDESGSEPEA